MKKPKTGIVYNTNKITSLTDYHLEKRYSILEAVCGENRNNYSIRLDCSFISIRNNKTSEGIYTDSLNKAKRWLKKDLKREG